MGIEFPLPPPEIMAAFRSLGGAFTPETEKDWPSFVWPNAPGGTVTVSLIGIPSYFNRKIQVFAKGSLLRAFPAEQWQLAALYVLSLVKGEHL